MATHSHLVRDTDPRFTINPVTRAIKNMTDGKVMLMQYVDGHDMSESTEAQIHFDNEGNRDLYKAKDLAVDPKDENKVTFSWVVSQNATRRAGKLEFLVKFRCCDKENIVVYEWNSDIHELTVNPGKDHSANGVALSADVIRQLREELVEEIEKTFDNRLKVEKWTFTLDDGTRVVKEVWVP